MLSDGKPSNLPKLHRTEKLLGYILNDEPIKISNKINLKIPWTSVLNKSCKIFNAENEQDIINFSQGGHLNSFDFPSLNLSKKHAGKNLNNLHEHNFVFKDQKSNLHLGNFKMQDNLEKSELYFTSLGGKLAVDRKILVLCCCFCCMLDEL